MTSTAARRLGVGALAPALGAVGHVEAGGGLPEITVPVLVVAFLTAGAAALVVGRRIGAVRLAVVLAAGQVGWHLAMGSAGAPDEHMAHGMAHATTPSPGMVGAHAVATVLVALGAAGADRALAAMVGERVGAVLALVAPRPAAAPSTPRPVTGATSVALAVVLLHVRPLRGPPERPAAA